MVSACHSERKRRISRRYAKLSLGRGGDGKNILRRANSLLTRRSHCKMAWRLAIAADEAYCMGNRFIVFIVPVGTAVHIEQDLRFFATGG